MADKRRKKMKLGILSDTHGDKQKATRHIIEIFKRYGVEIIIHCGDISKNHVNKKLFGNLPVFCALTDEQTQLCQSEKKTKDRNNIPFCSPPNNWTFTHPNERIVDLRKLKEKTRVYVGHKRSFELLRGSEAKLKETLDEIRKEYDNVRYMFSGHTHHQICLKYRLITFINPGAIENPMGIAGGCGYAIIDTEKEEIIYSRIPMCQSIAPELKVAIISDSADISKKDPTFWEKLRNLFLERNVTDIIHCGNINLDDIGISELDKFQVHYSLIQRQIQTQTFKNWHKIEDKITPIKGYGFFVHWDLGSDLISKSEFDMNCLARQIQREHSQVKFILSGFTHDAFYEEDINVIFLNPGDIIQGRNYAIIEMPKYEITLGRIPYDPLPDL
ncbi:metallophosphoesterase family protein [Patescibacteria group bacterium]